MFFGAIIIYIIIIITSTISCSVPPVKEIVYVTVKDSIGEQENISKIIKLEHELKLTRDSLNMIRDSIGEDLIVAKIKLARIKEYNRIAGQGNNIKYLRGWINRVLNE